MSSRKTILAAIRANKPEVRNLPHLNFQANGSVDMLQQYKASLEKNGGKLFVVENRSLIGDFIKKQFPDAKIVCSLLNDVEGNRSVTSSDDPHGLNNVDVAILNSKIGVAENAALWIDEPDLPQRVLPFITQHLVVVINKSDLVPTMHQAYEMINFSESSYGVFIAGPSKTADIEQSLVIGAHGARSLSVVLVDKE